MNKEPKMFSEETGRRLENLFDLLDEKGAPIKTQKEFETAWERFTNRVHSVDGILDMDNHLQVIFNGLLSKLVESSKGGSQPS